MSALDNHANRESEDLSNTRLHVAASILGGARMSGRNTEGERRRTAHEALRMAEILIEENKDRKWGES